MQLPDISNPWWFIAATLFFFLLIMGRYFLFAGMFYLIFHRSSRAKWQARKLGKRQYPPQQFRREVRWSLASGAIFSIAGAVTLLLWQQGHTRIYTNADEYGLWYLPVSLVAAMVIHETYYYWLHRWMHQPAIFRIVHKVHHDSNITSPWTAFSFHPLEALLQAIILPAILLVLPLHYYAIALQLTLMTFSSVINHLDIEIYPRRFAQHFLGRWLIGATHHSLHHRQFRYNFGLYFTFWDKWKKTESPLYEDTFKKVTEAA